MSTPLFVGSYFLPNKKEETFASNDNFTYPQ